MSLQLPLLYDNKEPVNTCIINMNDVRHNHQCLMDNGKSIDNRMVDLINVFGGIDDVLQHYLSSQSNVNLSQIQLQQINDILLSPITTKYDAKNSTLHASMNNTVLHSVFNNNRARQIINFLFGRICTGFITLTIVYMAIFGGWFVVSYEYVVYVIWWLFMLILGVYAVLILLSLNRNITKQIITTFEFWFKLYSFIKFHVCYMMVEVYYLKRPVVTIVWFNIFAFVCLLLIIDYSLVDALNIQFYFKATFMVIGCIGMSVWAFAWTFGIIRDIPPISITIFNNEIDFHFVPMAADALRALSIFMWKQTIASMWKKTKSTSIKQSPNIIWS
eukprot:210691_1